MFKNVFELSRKIFSHIVDDYSKEIFMYRLRYSATGDIKYLKDMIATTKCGKKFIENMKRAEKVVFFGVGGFGGTLYSDQKPSKCVGFIDNNKNLQGKRFCDLPVYSLEEYLEMAGGEGDYFFLTTQHPVYNSEIKKQLLKAGISQDRIVDGLFELDQYFDLEELPHVENESFIDVGVCDGYSSFDFINWANGNYEHIYCLEPDPKNISTCEKNLSKLMDSGKLTLFNKGAWSHSGKLKFDSRGTGSSMINDEGETTIDVVALDDLLGNKKITFIKMDVEGSEAEVIKGAKKIISEQRPKMAVCIYHKPEDVLELPALLLEYNPDYKFYIRHYTPHFSETVLYAI